MPSYFKRKTIRVCPVHIALMDMAVEALETTGVFNKETILQKSGYQVMADSIRWDYIRGFIETEQNCELIPLAATYFKHKDANKDVSNAKKYIAHGWGKRTHGFASIIEQNKHLVIRRIQQKEAIAEGKAEAAKALTDHAESRLPGIGQEVKALTDLT